MSIKIFFCEELPRYRLYLRRSHGSYARSGRKTPCTESGPYSYCNAMYHLGDYEGSIEDASHLELDKTRYPEDGPLWPTVCEKCGTPFDEEDENQYFTRRLYRRMDTGEIYTPDNFPIGAVWEAPWYKEHGWYGPDGRSLMCRVPGPHDWCIDSQASNCTMPSDNVHRCWVRHGRPEDGTLHVDKNGNTCQAGAGSIAATNWHGFLHHGHLVTA